MKVIARIRSDFPTKFGIPRQSGLASSLKAKVVFEPEYRSSEAVSGLENFSHIWLIWEFSEAKRENWSPLVRPPRLGGNKKVGVFATRSPFRPNPLGLSLVKIDRIENCEIFVSGADLMDGTPIYDIKPYLPETEAVADAKNLFAESVTKKPLKVEFSLETEEKIPREKLEEVKEILALDPRPAYHDSSERIYGFLFSQMEIKFKVEQNLLTVISVEEHV